jgi:hypothetical protein
MITFDDDTITVLFPNGQTRRHQLKDIDGLHRLDHELAVEPGHANAWLRRVDAAMFANDYEPCY